MKTAVQFNLSDRPQVMNFGSNAEADLVTALRAMERHTVLRQVNHPRDVMLDSTGHVQRKLRYSTTALQQLCLLLSPGLTHVMDSVCGNRMRAGEQADPDLAVKILNDLIALRFGTRLEDKMLVVNNQTKQIDGLVGVRYARLANLELYQRALAFVSKTAGMKFCEAALAGRRMMLRFAGTVPLFEVTVPGPGTIGQRPTEPFFGGFHFSNSEVGDCSIRASTLLIRQACDNKAIGGFQDGGRLLHIRGPKFEEKFTQLLTRVQSKADESATLRRNVLRLMNSSLHLVPQPTALRNRLDNLIEQLHRHGMTRKFAAEVIGTAAYTGSYGGVANSTVNRRDEAWLARRSAYDVFNAMTHVAKSQAIETRENAEQLAYQLLLGKFILR